MFKEMGQMMSLVKNLPKLKSNLEQFQSKLDTIQTEGQSGGGMVTAKVNGRMELIRCQISPEALALDDRELLEDLIVAAVNQAMGKVRVLVQEESQKLAGEMGLPAGMGLPEL